MRFAEPVGVEALELDRGLRAAAGEQARDDLLLQHPAQLARHAGGEEEPRVADIHREAAGGADRVVEHLRVDRQHRLLAVVGRHDAVAAGEEASIRASHSSFSTSSTPAACAAISCDRSSTVGPRPPLTITASARSAASRNAVSRVSRSSPTVVPQCTDEPDILELLCHVAEIGVDDLAGEHLVAGADDLDPHDPAFAPIRSRPRR